VLSTRTTLYPLRPDAGAFTSTAKIDYAIGIPGPVLPIYVNAYLPPQPTMERCYAFSQAVARTVTALGLKTVILRMSAAFIAGPSRPRQCCTPFGRAVADKKHFCRPR
jgi:hypothetical protein